MRLLNFQIREWSLYRWYLPVVLLEDAFWRIPNWEWMRMASFCRLQVSLTWLETSGLGVQQQVPLVLFWLERPALVCNRCSVMLLRKVRCLARKWTHWQLSPRLSNYLILVLQRAVEIILFLVYLYRSKSTSSMTNQCAHARERRHSRLLKFPASGAPDVRTSPWNASVKPQSRWQRFL